MSNWKVSKCDEDGDERHRLDCLSQGCGITGVFQPPVYQCKDCYKLFGFKDNNSTHLTEIKVLEKKKKEEEKEE